MDSDNQKINKIALLGIEAKCLIETFKQFQYTSERHGALKPFLGVSNGYIPFVNMMLIQDFSVIAFEICNFFIENDNSFKSTIIKEYGKLYYDALAPIRHSINIYIKHGSYKAKASRIL